jgi:hypothetical protein
VIVVDVHHLLAALARTAMGRFPSEDSEHLFTTSTWYYRLARAAHDPGFVGSLTRRIGSLDDEPRGEVLDMLDQLPDAIGLLAPRTLVPVMAKLSESVHLNHLGAEAVATAILTDATLLVVASSTFLESACERFGIVLSVDPT